MASPATDHPVTQVLDRTKLAGLRGLIGPAKCDAALGKFKVELFACLAAIKISGPERAEHLHNLAGVSGLLGFDELSVESRRLMDDILETADDSACTDAFLKVAQRAIAELETGLHRPEFHESNASSLTGPT